MDSTGSMEKEYAGPDFTRTWEKRLPAVQEFQPTPLDLQVGGGHYKDLKIQPVEYIHANGIPYIEGAIIKYATRWRSKGGIEDLKKIAHFAELLIQLEQGK